MPTKGARSSKSAVAKRRRVARSPGRARSPSANGGRKHAPVVDSEADPLAPFVGCIDLAVHDVADRHDAYLADAVDPPRR